MTNKEDKFEEDGKTRDNWTNHFHSLTPTINYELVTIQMNGIHILMLIFWIIIIHWMELNKVVSVTVAVDEWGWYKAPSGLTHTHTHINFTNLVKQLSEYLSFFE